MKSSIRIPFFEMSVKNYIYGDKVLELALAADRAVAKYDIDVIFISPYTEIRRIAGNAHNLIVIAPYMDLIPLGRGMADILPEALKDAGARGVVINHSERPMSLTAIKKTIERANELDMLSFACADTIAEAKAIAQLHPDIINPEPSELIGSGAASDMSYVLETVKVIKDIFPDILVEQAAGISTAEQVYDFIMAGSDGAGSCSGIMNSKDPLALVDEMIHAVKKAKDALKHK